MFGLFYCKGVNGLFYFLEPANAVVIPKPTYISPAKYLLPFWKRLFPVNLPARELVTNANMLSVMMAMPTNIAPSNKFCARTFPFDGSTNCGRNAKKNNAVFGLRMLTANPCQ